MLEVVTSNKHAMGLYEDLGFTYVRTFKCYKNQNPAFAKRGEELSLERVNRWEAARYSALRSFSPSFIDSDRQIPHNFRNEILVEASSGDKMVGFILFNQRSGRISQMAVEPALRGHGIGSRLLDASNALLQNRAMTIMNIPEEAAETHAALTALGFENQVDQYEMELLI